MRSLLIFGFLLSVLFFGCDMFGTGDEVADGSRPSNIPYAEDLNDPFPDKTDSIIIASISQEDLGCFNLPLSSKPDYSLLSAESREDVSEYKYNKVDRVSPVIACINSDGTIPDMVSFIAVIINSYPSFSIEQIPLSMSNPIKDKPVYLQMSNYYNLIYTSMLQPGNTVDNSVTCMEGITLSESNSFTETFGVTVGATAGGSWGFFSAEISGEVSEGWEKTTTNSTEITVEDTYSHAVQFTPQENQTCVYALWQKVEVFQFVDSQGEPWTAASGYHIADKIGSDGIFGFESKIPTDKYEVYTVDWF